jgi:uncharacterized protein YbaA (DUF1428 family)
VLLRRLLVIWLLASAACALPATTLDAYRSKAADAAEEVLSQARTAILTAHLAGRDRLLRTAVAVQLQDAEEVSTSAVERFASVEPPDARADRLRTRILPLLQRVADVIARMRFEARRGHTGAVENLRSSLLGPADALERWATAKA